MLDLNHEDAIQCSILFESIVNLVILICNGHHHYFEESAIYTYFLTSGYVRCPVCRNIDFNLVIVDLTAESISRILSQIDVEFVRRYVVTGEPTNFDDLSGHREEFRTLSAMRNQLISARTIRTLTDIAGTQPEDDAHNFEPLMRNDSLPELDTWNGPVRAPVSAVVAYNDPFNNQLVVSSGFGHRTENLFINYSRSLFTGRHYRELQRIYTPNLDLLIHIYNIADGDRLRRVVIRFVTQHSDNEIHTRLDNAGFVVFRFTSTSSFVDSRVIISALAVTVNDELVTTELVTNILSRG
jgi:hypothetical protein